MTDEQIIKALGLCSSEHLGCEDGCPYTMKACMGGDAVMKDALKLINRQKAEIERFKQNEQFISAKCDSIQEKLLLLKNTQIPEAIKIAKSEAIKEFAERLKKFSQWDIYLPDYVFVDIIDHLVKELTE